MYRKAILKILSKSVEKWWSYSANKNVNRQTTDIMITIPFLPRGKISFYISYDKLPVKLCKYLHSINAV